MGKGISDSSLSASPCAPSNAFRVIKLGSIKSVADLRLRSIPVGILQRLKLVDQVLPISNFFLKVALAPGVTDSELQEKLTFFNKQSSDSLFQCFYNGTDTFDLNPSLRRAKVNRSFFVVDIVHLFQFRTLTFLIFLMSKKPQVSLWSAGQAPEGPA